MRASVTSLQAVLVVRGSSQADETAALGHIAAVDLPSAAVPMRQLALIHIGASGSGLAVHFGDNLQVLALGGCSPSACLSCPPQTALV